MKNKILILLLSMLGMTACSDKKNPHEEPIPCAYGVPTAVFTIKGRVTDSAGNPVKGIRTTPVQAWHRNIPTPDFIPDQEIETNPLVSEPVYTSDAGQFEIQNSCFGWNQFYVTLRVEDVDGEQNGGSFKASETEVEITRDNATQSGSWTSYYTKQAPDIVMNRTKDE